MNKIISDPNEIAKIILQGGVVLMQVDTTYGLVCDAGNNNAIAKIENIKHRNKPSFGVFIRDLQVAKKYITMSNMQEKCFNSVFPGKFTLIFKANDFALKNISEKVFGSKIYTNTMQEKKIKQHPRQYSIKTIGVRLPEHRFCQQVLNHFNSPLVETSANISGRKTPSKFEDIDASILNAVDGIYYDNKIKIASLSSTIIDLCDVDETKKDIKIIRNGSGDVRILEKLLK